MAAFQIEAMPFQIGKHVLNPHATTVQTEGGSNGSLVGGQKPRLFFAFAPIDDQIGQLVMDLGQPLPTQPATTGSV